MVHVRRFRSPINMNPIRQPPISSPEEVEFNNANLKLNFELFSRSLISDTTSTLQ